MWLKLTKNRQNALQKHWYLLHWVHHNIKIDDYEFVDCRILWIYDYENDDYPLYLIVNYGNGYIEEKMEIKT